MIPVHCYQDRVIVHFSIGSANYYLKLLDNHVAESASNVNDVVEFST